MPREKRPAKEIRLTEQRVGKRHLIYVNGIAVFVTFSCFEVIRRLVRARLDGPEGGYLPNRELNAQPDFVRTYIRAWERAMSDPDLGGDSHLVGVIVFESDSRGHWRIIPDRDQIKFEVEFGRGWT